MFKVIKKWEDLEGLQVGNFIISICDSVMICKEKDDGELEELLILNFYDFSREHIIGILKAIGLQVEFAQESTITTNDRMWLLSMKFDNDFKLSKSINVWSQGREFIGTKHLLKTINFGEEYSVSELLSWKVSDKA